ncbi:ABC transporter permease [Aquisalinus flavus]|uniref:Transport permease protein n=1 Tax=Aquisalinus flavus TaxID=1526572 RepID=A0A8J2V4K0_9PROT|nr:ABC transporter permease [Aquisalinus flavus]MBD0426225.1 ABC transporter permease [Aquisalinus flavus]UNE48203.1 hypothetical protein FF099_09140 [Aquisalinus flavus]GGD09605.1 sugar ABC transporter permease [Aquisalinus flavus]
MSDMFEAQRRAKGSLGLGALDIIQGFKEFYLWSNLAIEDLRSSYHRTYFGYLWFILIYLIQIGIFILIFAPVRGIDTHTTNYPAYLSFGFLIWMFITSGITTGARVFINARGWILSANVPYSLFLFRNCLRDAIPLLINLVVILTLAFFIWDMQPLSVLISLATLPVFFINFFWVGLLLGTICVRFRDIEQLVSVAMRVIFFLTPIIWTYDPDGAGFRNQIAIYNPLTHFIELFRRPMLGEWPTELSLLVVAVVTVVGSITGFLVFALNRRRIPFWL